MLSPYEHANSFKENKQCSNLSIKNSSPCIRANSSPTNSFYFASVTNQLKNR